MFAKLPTIFVKAIFANLWNYFLLKKLPKLVLSKKIIIQIIKLMRMQMRDVGVWLRVEGS